MEYKLWPLGFIEFFAKQQSSGSYENEILLFCKNIHETKGSQFIFLELNNIYLIYIYLLLLYNSSIVDNEHSPYYIAFGSTHTYKVI